MKGGMVMNKIKISACFCEIPLKKLIPLVRMRYEEGIETQELMRRIESQRDREYLATIALLDVEEKDVMNLVDAADPSLLQHLLSCRLRAKQILKRRHVQIPEHEEDHGK